MYFMIVVIGMLIVLYLASVVFSQTTVLLYNVSKMKCIFSCSVVILALVLSLRRQDVHLQCLIIVSMYIPHSPIRSHHGDIIAESCIYMSISHQTALP